jgi:hypothetical protein
MPICDTCMNNEADCHDGFEIMKLVREIRAWKEGVCGSDLTRVPDWADGCPGYERLDTRPFATPEEVRQHRDEEECLDELIEKAVCDGRLEKDR